MTIYDDDADDDSNGNNYTVYNYNSKAHHNNNEIYNDGDGNVNNIKTISFINSTSI